MAITKTDISFQTSATNTATSTTTGTGVDLSAGYGATCNIRITNGATGPTTPCRCDLEVSNDNSDYYIYRTIYGSTVNDDVVEASIEIPAGYKYARTVFTGNDDQSVTIESDGTNITAIS